MGQYANFYNSNNQDRVYDAESFSEWLRPFFTTGVFNGNLQVTASSGMTVSVSPGYVNIDGKTRYFETATSFTLDTAHATMNRIDSIVVRRNDTDRNITLMVQKGTNSLQPVAVAPVRTGGIYDLVIAHVYVSAAAISISQANITDTRADNDLCGWVVQAVDSVDFSQFIAQMNTQFSEWFDAMKGQLTTDAAGNLQTEIDEINTDLTSINNEMRGYTEATLTTGGWSTVSGGYVQTLTVTGLTSSMVPTLAMDDDLSVSSSVRKGRIKAFAYITDIASATNALVVHAHTLPTVAIPVQVRWC